MVNKLSSRIIFMVFCPILIFGQTNSLETNLNSESYWSSNKTKVSIGWQSQYKPVVINSVVHISLSYSMSNFYHSPERVSNQVGLFNEFGINNSEVYLEFGPEIRLFKSIYIIPQGRVSFAWISGVEKGGIGFLYYYGGCIGFVQPLNNKTNLSLEIGTRVLPIGENQNIFYLKAGLLFNLF